MRSCTFLIGLCFVSISNAFPWNFWNLWNAHEQSKFKLECNIPEVFLAYVDDVITVSWPQVDSTCTTSPVYKVQYWLDEVENLTDTIISPEFPVAQLPIGKLTCERVSVKILVKNDVESDQIIGESEIVELERDLDDISGLISEQTSEGLILKWEPIDLGESCEVIYKVTYSLEGDEPKESETTENRFVVPITETTPCTLYNIKLQGISNGLETKVVDGSYEIGIPKISDVSITNSKGKVHIDYKSLKNIPLECGDVSYRIIEEDLGCFATDITILPVSDRGTEGSPWQKVHYREPPPVQNLLGSELGTKVRLRWEPPLGTASHCTIAYFITSQSNPQPISTYYTEYDVKLDLQSCKKEVLTVQAAVITEDLYYVKGLGNAIEMIGEIEEIPELNCMMNGDKIDCVWSQPEGVDFCMELFYRVLYFDGDLLGEEDVKRTEFTFNVVKKAEVCLYRFVVRPVARLDNGMEFLGPISEVDIEGCIDIKN